MAAIPARAQQPIEPWKSPHLSVAARDLYQAASAVPASEGTNVVLLEDDESFTFDDAGRLTHVGYFVYKVLTQKGAEGWDAFSVGWQPWHQQRPEIRVRVITSDLVEHLLDPKTITEGPAREGEYKIYSDAKRIRAPFPAVAPGAVIEEEYIERETEPLFAAGLAGWTSLAASAFPWLAAGLNSMRLRPCLCAPARCCLPDVKPLREESNGRVKLTSTSAGWRGSTRAIPICRSDVPVLPELHFSTGASWQAVATGYGKIVDAHADVAAVQDT